jgi:hypothetical protein
MVKGGHIEYIIVKLRPKERERDVGEELLEGTSPSKALGLDRLGVENQRLWHKVSIGG